MKTKFILFSLVLLPFFISAQTSFTPGRIVAVQTSGATTKFGSAVTLKEYTTSGGVGTSVSLPSTGSNPIQMAATHWW